MNMNANSFRLAYNPAPRRRTGTIMDVSSFVMGVGQDPSQTDPSAWTFGDPANQPVDLTGGSNLGNVLAGQGSPASGDVLSSQLDQSGGVLPWTPTAADNSAMGVLTPTTGATATQSGNPSFLANLGSTFTNLITGVIGAAQPAIVKNLTGATAPAGARPGVAGQPGTASAGLGGISPVLLIGGGVMAFLLLSKSSRRRR